jgi:hypothetical protein
VDYIYLDTDERRRFAQQSHEYLIDQLQYGLQQSVTSQTVRLDLTLNHPIKELVWVYQDARKLDCSLVKPVSSGGLGTNNTQPFAYDDIANRCRLQLNGQDRFDERYGDYFWKVQPYQHHSGGAFEPHAYTSLAASTVTGSTAGSLYVVFTGTATSGAQTLGTVGLVAGATTLAQVQGITFTIVSGVNASGVPMVTPGTTVTFATATSGTLGANALGAASTGTATTFYAVYEPNNTLVDVFQNAAVSGINTGYQTTNPDAIGVLAGQPNSVGYTQSVNPINVYSFALAPEEHQPSGSCNFSRIDTTTLVFDSIVGMDGRSLAAGSFPSKNYPYLFRMYAVNYNIFRVMSGMGGLAYSN